MQPICSKQDPNFPVDETKRIHRKGKGCRAESPPDEMKVKCPRCHELFRGIDFKGHIKTKHSSNSSIIKCFECQYEAESLENFKTHAKQHYSTDKEVKHEKCNVCYKVFKNKLELGRHMESVHKEECEVLIKNFQEQNRIKEAC